MKTTICVLICWFVTSTLNSKVHPEKTSPNPLDNKNVRKANTTMSIEMKYK